MESLALILAIFLAADPAAGSSWSDSADGFSLGPAAPQVDLRNMLTQHVVRRSCQLLDATTARRREAFASGDWKVWREDVREAVRKALGPMPCGPDGPLLNVRAVSAHDRPGYRLENVLFESLPGLDVNASVYLPLEKDFPPPWPGIVVPVGHSAKTRESYQKPAQVFARMGYVAITFDPPDMAGEKRAGNDHFVDGVRCYLTGHSSNRYFVVDALRCIDYLASRPDIDMSNGVGMTGVSGGGVTTMFATVLDDRVRAAGPSCCAVPKAMHPVLDHYAECPEPLPFNRFAEYDDPDLLAAALPAAVLFMAGAEDEVFTETMSRRMAAETAASAKAAGHEERFAFFLDPGGHAYTVAMALEFVRWMDRWVRDTPGRELPHFDEGELEMLADGKLACHPRQDTNMVTCNRDLALELRERRSSLPIAKAVREVARVPESLGAPEARLLEPSRVWHHYLQELMLVPEPGIELPATYLYPAKEEWHGVALLYFDDRGRWTGLRSQGPLAKLVGFLNEGTDGPALLSVDLRGWGDTQPANVRYDLASWGSAERWLAYVSAAAGDPVLAMRIRDGLLALAWLNARPEIERVILGGHGMGGVVALHVAAVAENVAGVFCESGLAAFELLATSSSYSWSPETFLPCVLQHYDLPELVAALAMPTLLVRPLDASKKALSGEEAGNLYATALASGGGFRLEPELDYGAIGEFVRQCMMREAP